MHAALREAVSAGLVLRSDDSYAFLHDRIQEAAYALIPQGERVMAHLRIGRLLAARTAAEALEEKIFDIVSQFDRGPGAAQALQSMPADQIDAQSHERMIGRFQVARAMLEAIHSDRPPDPRMRALAPDLSLSPLLQP